MIFSTFASAESLEISFHFHSHFCSINGSTELIGDGFKEVFSVQIHALGDVGRSVNTNGQVFCHLTSLDRINAGLFQAQCESFQLRRVVELGSMSEAASPSEDRRDRVGRGRLTFLMLTVNEMEVRMRLPFSSVLPNYR